MRALEKNFPFEELDPIAEKESYRKEINRPIYHTHKWWAQRLGSVFRALTLGAVLDEDFDIWGEFYKKHNFRDAVVLDPFMGSGTTLGEALKLGCRVIGSDINPVSTFVVSQCFRSIPAVRLLTAFEEIEAKVKRRINKYYVKRHPRTGEQCKVLYYFWVKEVTTPDGKTISLFPNYIFSKNAYPAKKPVAQILCPVCGEVLQGRYDSDSQTCPSCKSEFNPQKGNVEGQYVIDHLGKERYKIVDLIKVTKSPPKNRMYACLVINGNGEKEYLRVSQEDIELFVEAEAELQHENLPLPEGKIDPGHNANQVLNYNYSEWRDFFNPRQLLCLGLLLKAILELEEREIRDVFICLFSGILEFNNMFCSFKGEGTGAVRHLFYNHILKPEKLPLENSIWGAEKGSGTFVSLFKSRLLKAQEYREKPFELCLDEDRKKIFSSNPIKASYVPDFKSLLTVEKSALVLNGDSAVLPIPDKCVDAIVTDPPYFDFVHYSELSDFFFAWLKPALQDDYPYFRSSNSRRSGEVQQKNRRDFSFALARVFTECYRVLKDDGVLVFSFHHSRSEGWLSIYQAISEAGLYIENVYPVKAEMSVGAPKSAAKSPINLDALIVCKKRLVEADLNDILVEDVVASSLSDFHGFEDRFAKVRRALSGGDRKVIFSSMVLKHSSKHNLSLERVKICLEDSTVSEILRETKEFV